MAETMKHSLFSFCILFFLIETVVSKYPYNVNLEDQLKEKCISRPGHSFFYRDKARCISRRAYPGLACVGEPETVGYTEDLQESFSSDERRLTLFSGAAKENEMSLTVIYTCTLSAGVCAKPENFTQIALKCYHLDRTPRTYEESWNYCRSLGSSNVVLTQDRDVRDALKFVTTTQPDVSAVWTGLRHDGDSEGWIFSHIDYGKADYARWMPDSNFTAFPLAAVLHTLSYDPVYGSHAGYMSARNQGEKFPSLCVASIVTAFTNDVYLQGIFTSPITTTTVKPTTAVTTTPVKTTVPAVTTTTKATTKAITTTTTKVTTKVPTTTTKATTTTATTMETIDELVNNRILGRVGMDNILYRSYSSALIFHQYHRDINRYCGNNMAKERFVGFLVNPYMTNVLRRCPDLIKMNMFQNRGAQAWTLFDTSETNPNLNYVSTFYCSPRKGYCGANFEMVEYLGKVGAGDKFIASFTAETEGIATNSFYQNKPNRRLCWIWRDAPSNLTTQFNTARNLVLNAGNPIMRTLLNRQNAYSVSRTDHNNLISRGRKAQPDVGFVVTHEMWLDTFRSSCPELIPIGVHRRSGSLTTYFGHNPPFTADRIGGFYCAPRRGYCGADYLLRQRPTQTVGLDNYATDNYEEYENVRCTGKARYAEEDEAVCWIWKQPSTYKI